MRCKGKPNTNIEENRRRYLGKPEIEMQKIREQTNKRQENRRQMYRKTKDLGKGKTDIQESQRQTYRKTGDRGPGKPETNILILRENALQEN